MVERLVSIVLSTGRLTVSLSRSQRVLLLGGGLLCTSAVVIAFRQTPLSALALGALVAVGAWLSAIDVAVHRLPNVIVVPLTGMVTTSLFFAGLLAGDVRRPSMAIGVGILVAAVFFLGNLIGVIGMGDVKYALPVFSVAAWFGVTSFQTMLMAMTISATAVMIVTSVRTRSSKVRIAYGPYMSLGLTAALLTAGF